MLTIKKLRLLGAAAVCLALLSAARADTFTDASSAVLVWPLIVVGNATDTVVQMTNQANVPVSAHCFYVNANSRCTNTGGVCDAPSDCAVPGAGFGACVPGWIEINFNVNLTLNQPVGWSAEEGFGGSALPCPGGLGNICPGSNAGTRVPPVGETPFIGELKCIQVNPDTRLPRACGGGGPACRNDLEGGATITSVVLGGAQAGLVNPARYNAVGLRTTAVNDGNNLLCIGGGTSDQCPLGAEYQPCSEVLVFNHLFDLAVDPLDDSATQLTSSFLALVPCTQDFLTQEIPSVTAQFLVYNEFEQRLSTSVPVRCALQRPISLIDTTQPNRSIFSANVSGTIAGQTRITGVGGGLIAAATLGVGDNSDAGYNLNQFADREDPDFIRIP